MISGLTVTVEDGDPAVVTVAGEVDLLTVPALAEPLRRLIVERGPPGIEVDLAAVPFMDSTGIQVLVAARADAQQAGIPFRVRSASSSVMRVLTLTGLLDALGLEAP
jgi:anti-sigma B factor antagonist